MSDNYLKFIEILNKIIKEGRFYRFTDCLGIYNDKLWYDETKTYSTWGQFYALKAYERQEARQLSYYYELSSKEEQRMMNEMMNDAANVMAGTQEQTEILGGTVMEEQNTNFEGLLSLTGLMADQEYGSFIEGPELKERFANQKVKVLDIVAMNKKGTKATDGNEAKYVLLELDIKDENGLNRVMLAPGYTKKALMMIAAQRFDKGGLASGDKKFREYISAMDLTFKVKDAECVTSIDGKHQDAVIDFYQGKIRIDFNRIR